MADTDASLAVGEPPQAHERTQSIDHDVHEIRRSACRTRGNRDFRKHSEDWDDCVIQSALFQTFLFPNSTLQLYSI